MKIVKKAAFVQTAEDEDERAYRTGMRRERQVCAVLHISDQRRLGFLANLVPHFASSDNVFSHPCQVNVTIWYALPRDHMITVHKVRFRKWFVAIS
jgi:hypothetical protein